MAYPLSYALTLVRAPAAAAAAVILAAGGPVGLRAQAPTPAVIRVGSNVRVSTDSLREHVEVHLTADPQDPTRLAACSMVEGSPGGGIPGVRGTRTVLYVSQDAGRTWAPAVEDSALVAPGAGPRVRTRVSSWDPTCGYGRDGMLYFATATRVDTGSAGSRVRVHRSPDAGRTWLTPTEIAAGFYDKPWLVADTRPQSPYVDRLYLAYWARQESRWVTLLLSSTDRGTSFTVPVVADTAGGPNGGVVLSDGTLVLVGDFSSGVLLSTDGGQHVTASRIAPFGYFPRIAADLGGSPFGDRTYVTWAAHHDGRDQVLVAYSADKGRTWSPPRVVNDDRRRLATRVEPYDLMHTVGRSGVATHVNRTGPNHTLPTIAVNRDGVVGISWYDRRDNPDDVGYYVRFAASLDGGETWLPSVRVSERPNVATPPLEARTPIGLSSLELSRDTASSTVGVMISRDQWVEGGHYAGLAAGADGVFHALWVDNRTGVKQVWTAPIRVPGRAGPDPALDNVRDVTNNVALTFNAFTFQRIGPTTGVVAGEVYVTNTSADTLRGPLRMQVLRLALTNPDSRAAAALIELDGGHRNRLSARVWDLDGAIRSGVLPPRGTSAAVPVRFRLTDLEVRAQDHIYLVQPLHFELRLRVLAGEKRPP